MHSFLLIFQSRIKIIFIKFNVKKKVNIDLVIIYSLLIHIKTWTKEYSDIYDYDSNEEKVVSLLVDKSGYLIRSKNNVSFVEYFGFNKYKESYERFKLAEIKYVNNSYSLSVDYPDNEISYDIDDKVYILVNSINGERINEENYYGYELNEGDIIKIGRFKIKVRKINLINKIQLKVKEENSKEKSENISIIKEEETKSKNSNNKSSNKNNTNINNINIMQDDKNNIQCRICFTNDESISPLISPCSCTGSSKYIHLLCLQQWLKSKIKLDYKNRNENLISAYKYQPAQCEICKEYMPDFIKKINKLYEICNYHINSDKNEESYFILETIGSVKNKEKYIYDIIIKSEESISTFIIGRYNESDIRLVDNTISRIHSVLTVSNNKLYIKDMNSKFGTGILFQNNNNFQFCDNNPISFQFGRSIITFCQYNKQNCFTKCFKKNSNKNESSEDNANFYINENKKSINYENGYNIKENK